MSVISGTIIYFKYVKSRVNKESKEVSQVSQSVSQ